MDITDNLEVITDINKYDYYKMAIRVLNDLFEKNTLISSSFWSKFVNKKYIIRVGLYSENEIVILRKEIELFAEFELEKCAKIFRLLKYSGY